METIDDDIASRAADFIQRQAKADKPFFVWVNFTHMHFRTHVKPESKGQSGRWQGEYPDAMIDHDKNVGTVLKALDDAGIADNTFVMYSTDNGPHMNTLAGRRHDAVPQREELELGRGLPRAVHGPLAGQDQAGQRLEPDRRPPRLAADTLGHGGRCRGDHAEAAQGLQGRRHDLQGPPRRLQPRPVPDRASPRKSPRESFLYCNDDQQLTGLRYDNWKLVFMEQRAQGTLRIWAEPFTTLRVPKIFNLRLDPYERADITSNTYYDWLLDHAFLLVPAQDYVGKFLMTFKEYPQRQKAASFNLDEVLQKLKQRPD